MKMKNRREEKSKSLLRKAQSTLDYAVIIAVVAAALLAMNTYVQRAVKANLKVIEEQVNASVIGE